VDAFNRAAVVGLAFAWVILMALVILLTWGADTQTIDRLGDLVSYLSDHTDNASKLILTFGVAALIVLSLTVIVAELVPAEPERQVRLESVTGATAILPTEAITQRLEQALCSLPQVQEAQAMVATRDRGLAVALNLTLAPDANVPSTTEQACHLVQETVEQQMGVALVGLPAVQIHFGPPAPTPAPEPPPPPPEADAKADARKKKT
jgi:phosphotransferase system  glucose/maltose/N-acetylglucosamine-specific IIC component